MFKRKKPSDSGANSGTNSSSTSPLQNQQGQNVRPLGEATLSKSEQQKATTVVTDYTLKELSARFASLYMIAYRRGDISALHISLTAFTHTLHALGVWGEKQAISEQFTGYVLHEGFPLAEQAQLSWMVNHYFEQANAEDESCLLNWYQALDDEWVLRKKLREMFPEKNNSELTQLIAQEQAKMQDEPKE